MTPSPRRKERSESQRRKQADESVSSLLKPQRLGLLDLRQRLHLAKHVSGHSTVDLDQRDGIAALLGAAGVERRDVEFGGAEQAGEGADEAGLVLVGDVDHRLAELGVDADALDVDQPRLAVGIDGARDRTL